MVTDVNEIEIRLRRGGGILRRADNADLAGRLDTLLRRRELVAVHPGVYCRPDTAGDTLVRILAAASWAGPDAVLTGWAAARLTFLPDARVPVVTLALPTSRRAPGGIAVERRRIAPELVQPYGPLVLTRPSLTALDLADSRTRASVVDEVLRTGAATLQQLWAALELTPNRRGNAVRRAVLVESRAEPWSEAERALHLLLWQCGIAGWISNAWVLGYRVDVLFAAAMLVIEVDGWEIHRSRDAFEHDRRRRNELELAGYRVLNFTWRHIVEQPGWVIECVLRGLADERCSLVTPRTPGLRSA